MHANEDSIDLLDLWRVLRDGWWMFAGAVAGALVVAAIYLAVAEPEYRASTVITEVSSGGQRAGGASALLGQFGGLASLAGIDVGALSGTRSDGRTIIQSRTFAEEFIARNNLLPHLFSDYWDSEANTWRPPFDQAPPKLSSGAGRLRNAIELTVDRETGLLTLAVEWTDRELAAEWANGLVSQANEIARKRDIAEAQRTVAYLNSQIESTNVVELQRVLYSLLESEQRTLMLANAREEYVFKVIDSALVPGSPAWPKRNIVLILAIFLGLVVGAIAVYVRVTVRHLREEG